MADRESFFAALQPALDAVAQVDAAAPDARARLEAALPLEGAVLVRLRAEVRAGVAGGWLATRANGAIRYERLLKPAAPGAHSVDIVHMASPGPGHAHPRGEIDLCFAVSGAPTFDGQPEGWTVYAPGTWHVPTVTGGAMDILYFLPDGAIVFGPAPE